MQPLTVDRVDGADLTVWLVGHQNNRDVRCRVGFDRYLPHLVRIVDAFGTLDRSSHHFVRVVSRANVTDLDARVEHDAETERMGFVTALGYRR